MKSFIRRQLRKKTRVYILPTPMGAYFNGLIFLMFLLSVGYSNNLLLIFTIFLFGFNLLWVVQTHFHLHYLRPKSIRIDPGHAGDPLNVQIEWLGCPEGPLQWTSELESANHKMKVNLSKNQKDHSSGDATFERRGKWKWDYLRVSTNKPFGLYHVWSYYQIQTSHFVYPRLIRPEFLTSIGEKEDGDQSSSKKGDDEFRSFALYQQTESRKISWKHYARTGNLLIKEGEEFMTPAFKLHLILPQNEQEKEIYLSKIATQLVECHKKEIPFLLETANVTLGPANHLYHLHECLKVLSLC